LTLLAEAALSGGGDHVDDALQHANATRHSARVAAHHFEPPVELRSRAKARTRASHARDAAGAARRRGRAGADEEDGGSNVVTGRGTTVTRRTPAARVRDIRPVFNVLPGVPEVGQGSPMRQAPRTWRPWRRWRRCGSCLHGLQRPTRPHPASFTQTGHTTAGQLRDKDVNPAAAVFAFLLNSGAAWGT